MLMRLFFLGTAAAEGYPAIFCNCANCRQARLLGGRDQRFRSALLVNDDLLIDFAPELLASAPPPSTRRPPPGTPPRPPLRCLPERTLRHHRLPSLPRRGQPGSPLLL